MLFGGFLKYNGIPSPGKNICFKNSDNEKYSISILRDVYVLILRLYFLFRILASRFDFKPFADLKNYWICRPFSFFLHFSSISSIFSIFGNRGFIRYNGLTFSKNRVFIRYNGHLRKINVCSKVPVSCNDSLVVFNYFFQSARDIISGRRDIVEHPPQR